MATTKPPGHVFFSDQTTNFFLGHLLGILTSLGVTFIAWLIITTWVFNSLGIYTLILFAVSEFFIYQAIEATRQSIPPLHYVPITWNGKFYGKLAGPGSYIAPYPFGLIFAEMMNEEPKFFDTPQLQISSKNNEKLKGGVCTVSYRIDFSNGKKFTKNVQENFEKRIQETLHQEIITVVSNSVFSDPTSDLRTGLEQICKDMKSPPQGSKYEDVQKLCKESGVILESINIGEFNFEDEEDKDAAAKLQRQKNENAGFTAKIDLFTQKVTDYITAHPNTKQEDAEKIVAAAMNIIPSQNINITGTGNGMNILNIPGK